MKRVNGDKKGKKNLLAHHATPFVSLVSVHCFIVSKRVRTAHSPPWAVTASVLGYSVGGSAGHEVSRTMGWAWEQAVILVSLGFSTLSYILLEWSLCLFTENSSVSPQDEEAELDIWSHQIMGWANPGSANFSSCEPTVLLKLDLAKAGDRRIEETFLF